MLAGQKRRFALFAAGLLVFLAGVVVGVNLTPSINSLGQLESTTDTSVYTTKPTLPAVPREGAENTAPSQKQSGQPEERRPQARHGKRSADDKLREQKRGGGGGTDQMAAEGVPFQSKFPRSADCGEACCVPKSLELERQALRSQRFSPRNASSPKQRVSYIKTHKTGSSTLGSVFFRYGARHDLVLYKSPTHGLRLKFKNPDTTPADIVVYHYAGIPTGLKSIRAWEAAYDWYRDVVPGGAFVTILREPISHYLSYYYFYDEPKANSLPLSAFVERGNHANILMRDFGVHTKEEMDTFMHKYAPAFRTFLLSNRMHESLVILGNDLGWTLWDMTYTKLLDSSKEGFKRWDGKPVKRTPKIEDLDPDLRQKIEKLTALDKIAYDYALEQLERKIQGYGPGFRDAVEALEALNTALNAFCSCGDLGVNEHKFCQWYGMSDMKYERAISSNGKAKAFTLPYLPS